MIVLSIIISFLLLICVKYYEKFKLYLRHRKYSFKLPRPEPEHYLIGHLLAFIKPAEESFKVGRKWALDDKLYPIFTNWVGPIFHIIAVGPTVAQAVLSPEKHLEKGEVYKYFETWLGKGLLTSSGKLWQRRRKILTPAFHFSILKDFVGIFNNESNNMVQQIKQEIEKTNNNVILVAQFIDHMALRTINETSMGFKLDIETSDGLEYKNNIKKICFLIFNRLCRPWYLISSLYYNLVPDGIEEMRITKKLHEFTENVIKKRSENFKTFDIPKENEKEENFEFQKKKLAMLDLLLNEKIKKSSIDEEGIRDEVNTFMFGGHDTVSTSLGFTLMLLANHREIQDELYEEVIQVLGDDKSKDPDFKELQELSFMERCIKESLRLYPSAPFIGRILSEDIVTEYGLIPKGISMSVSIYDIHHNPKLWPDPEKFDPSRFLPENCKDRHAYSYIPFSAGPRNCIGQRYALLEIKAVLCSVLKNFILEPVDIPETILLIQDLVLRAKDGIRVKFIARN